MIEALILVMRLIVGSIILVLSLPFMAVTFVAGTILQWLVRVGSDIVHVEDKPWH